LGINILPTGDVETLKAQFRHKNIPT